MLLLTYYALCAADICKIHYMCIVLLNKQTHETGVEYHIMSEFVRKWPKNQTYSRSQGSTCPSAPQLV